MQSRKKIQYLKWCIFFSIIWHFIVLILIFISRNTLEEATKPQIYDVELDFSFLRGKSFSRNAFQKKQGKNPSKGEPKKHTVQKKQKQSPKKKKKQKNDLVIGVGEKGKKNVLKPSQLQEIFTAGGTSIYNSRTRLGRKAGIRKYGGSLGSESAVELGLKWLIRHQDEDGKWASHKFSRHCVGKPCQGRGYKRYNKAVTALSFMAFLGAGYTSKKGKYKKKLQKTRRYLLQTQKKDGFFSYEMYNNSIVLLALLELYGQTNDLELTEQIRKGIKALCLAQQIGGGWTYYVHKGIARNDSSITGWQILPLYSAKKLGFSVERKVLKRAWLHFKRFTLPTGEVRYADVGSYAFRRSDALTSVGLLFALLKGEYGIIQKRQAATLKKWPPDWSRVGTLDHCMYYWYYGTLAMFILGGEKWETWNKYLRTTLVSHQVKKGEERGSWPPKGKWGSAGGRVYSTAINILNLEIYYRYNPSFFRSNSRK